MSDTNLGDTILTFDSMDRILSVTIHWKAVEQYFTVALFGFQFYSLCQLETFINFGLGTVGSEGVQTQLEKKKMQL